MNCPLMKAPKPNYRWEWTRVVWDTLGDEISKLADSINRYLPKMIHVYLINLKKSPNLVTSVQLTWLVQSFTKQQQQQKLKFVK